MKKFITIIVMLLSVIVANAQIKITNTSNDRLVEVKSLYMADYNRLVKKGDSYLYVAKTSNQFDDSMVLLLGKNKEEILESLNTLYEAVDTIGDEEVITIDNGFGIEYRFNKWVLSEQEMKMYKRLSKLTKTELDPCFKVFSDHHAGYGTIWKSALKSAIDYFENGE